MRFKKCKNKDREKQGRDWWKREAERVKEKRVKYTLKNSGEDRGKERGTEKGK